MTNQKAPSSQLDRQLHEIASRLPGLKAPSLSYAVLTSEGVAASGAVGTADLRTDRAAHREDQYPWFSMTKIATATALMRLHDNGLVDVDAPVSHYLPGYETGREVSPTTRQLLTHTAGLGNPLPITWVRPDGQAPAPGLVDAILAKHGRPRRAPGGQARYSNIGYLLAGQVLEAVTGTSAEDAITDLVLRPLDMNQTGFSYNPSRPRATGYLRAPRAFHPMVRAILPTGIAGERAAGHLGLRPFLVEGPAYGGLIGTAADAAKLAAAHLTTSDGEAAALGPLDEMRRISYPGRPFDHGIGWFRKPGDAHRTPAFVQHYGTGGGFWNAMRIYPGIGVAIVGMTNGTSRWPFDDFCTAVINVLHPAS